MPDPSRLLQTIRHAAEKSRNTAGRKGSVISLQNANEVMVVGDLHGNLPAFKTILDLAALARNPERHLVLQELVHGPRMYPNDGGDRSHQLVDIVCALKCQYPERVHIVMGNHELSEITGRSIAKNGVALNALFRQGIGTAYPDHADAIYQAYIDFFKSMPLAIRLPNRVFICHTIPEARDLDAFDVTLLDQPEWPAEAMARGGTIYAMTWGRDNDPATLDRFAQIVDADLFVTGHQPCEEGFRQPNHRQIIIDGTSPCPAYCLFPARGPVTIDSLVSSARLMSMVA